MTDNYTLNNLIVQKKILNIKKTGSLGEGWTGFIVKYLPKTGSKVCHVPSLTSSPPRETPGR